MAERIDAQAGIVVRHLLKLSCTKTDLWRSESNPIPVMLVRDSISGDTNATDALKYTEQYIRVMGKFDDQYEMVILVLIIEGLAVINLKSFLILFFHLKNFIECIPVRSIENLNFSILCL